MSDPRSLTITSSDLLGAIALGAQRIVSATMQHAGGAPFPDPHAIKREIDRMSELNDALLTMQQPAANKDAA